MRILRLTLASLLSAMPLTTGAQRPDPAFEGPRGLVALAMTDGEPISFFLEWSRVLDLTEEQKSGLMDIRRRLRSRNAHLVGKLDSLRELAGVELSERTRLSAEDREALARFQAWSQPTIDSVRLNNDAARLEARSLLAEDQRARADSIIALPRARQGDGRERRAAPRPPPR
ncbi:MAG: Spy/CpxP family protein refolding chaperone, partial [Gemmatimonadota bacterium]